MTMLVSPRIATVIDGPKPEPKSRPAMLLAFQIPRYQKTCAKPTWRY